jgi:AcrR family transcriptional regulator
MVSEILTCRQVDRIESQVTQYVDSAEQVGSRQLEESASLEGEPPEIASTRDRILNVALELFTEKGFDGTSLREIAERLGVTKAAIYYHFASKDDILMALHMRLHEFGKDALSQMTDEPVTLQQWGLLLELLVGQMLAQRKLFLFHERNQAALEKLHRADHDAEHDDIQDKFRRVIADPRVSLHDRVRMACSLGAALGGLFMSGDAFEGTTNEELGTLLRDAVHDVLAG